MNNPYKILDVPYNASQSYIDIQYKNKKNAKVWGNSDYDNMREFIAVSNAYKVLNCKAYRFLYDIKADIPLEERGEISFESQKEINNFIKIVSEKISGLKSRSNEHLKSLKNQIKAISNLSKQNDSLNKELSYEKKRAYDMEEEISNLLYNIDNLKEIILDKEEDSKSLLDDIELLKKLIEENENQLFIVQSQNKRLLSILKKCGINFFKIVSAIIAVFALILFLIF